jgi:hypothetical protein
VLIFANVAIFIMESVPAIAAEWGSLFSGIFVFLVGANYYDSARTDFSHPDVSFLKSHAAIRLGTILAAIWRQVSTLTRWAVGMSLPSLFLGI